MTTPIYLTVPEVAERIRMSSEWVSRQCKAGVIPAKKLGRDWRISEIDLVAFMAAPAPAPSPRRNSRQGRTARQRRRARGGAIE